MIDRIRLCLLVTYSLISVQRAEDWNTKKGIVHGLPRQSSTVSSPDDTTSNTNSSHPATQPLSSCITFIITTGTASGPLEWKCCKCKPLYVQANVDFRAWAKALTLVQIAEVNNLESEANQDIPIDSPLPLHTDSEPSLDESLRTTGSDLVKPQLAEPSALASTKNLENGGNPC